MRSTRLLFTLAFLMTVSFVLVMFTDHACARARMVRVHSQMPVGHYLTKAVEVFIKTATEKSGGTLKFKHFPAQQLYKDREVVEAIPDGLIEMGVAMNISSWSGKMGEVNLGTLSSVWNDYDHYCRYLYDYKNGGGFNCYLYEKAKDKLNVVNLGSFPYARNHAVLTKSSIKSLDDWKGKKIRTGTKANAVFSEAIGASSVFMSSSETYMAMQRGVIDGAQSGFTSFTSRKWYEVAKYVTNVNCLLPEAFFTFVNKDFWESLDKKQRRAIIDGWYAAALFDERAAYEGELEARKVLEDNGVTIYDVPIDIEKQWKEKAVPSMKETLILTAVGGDKAEAGKIWQMIEATRNLPPSSDAPNKYEVPMNMYKMWYAWLLEKEGLAD